MSGSVIRQGYLVKSPSDPRSSVKSWRKRWVVLFESHLLKYFKDEGTYQRQELPKGDINLNDCTGIDLNVTLKYRQRDNMFVIKTRPRNYYFVSESASDMKEWVECICRLCDMFPESQRNLGQANPGSGPCEVSVMDGKPEATYRKPRAVTEPIGGAYSLVGQGNMDPVPSSSLSTSAIATSQPSDRFQPITSSYYRATSPQPTWQTSPISDTVSHSNGLQTPVSHGYDRLPPQQAPWQVSPSATTFTTSTSTTRPVSSSTLPLMRPHNRHYDIVPPPRPAPPWVSETLGLPDSGPHTGGSLNDRSRPHKRYDHPPGSSATSEYSVPPFSKEELYMVPRKSHVFGDPTPPVIDRRSKPDEFVPTIDRSLKPSQSGSPMLDQSGWKETNRHSPDREVGANRRIHYSEVSLPETAISPIGPSKSRTQYSEIDIVATMKQGLSDIDQGSRYQDDPHLVQSSGAPYINMQDMVVPLNKGGNEYYIAMQNGVLGEYYTYMKDQGMESDDIYSAASENDRPLSTREDPYGVMYPPGSHGMPPSTTMPRSIRTPYEV